MYRQPLHTFNKLLRNIPYYEYKHNNQQCRSVSTCVHVKGLPINLSTPRIYDFFKTYGTIKEVATYKEAPKYHENKTHNRHDFMNKKKQNFIDHNRPPGQTAIIRFTSTNSAIMCKEELHWRPFPLADANDNSDDNADDNADANTSQYEDNDQNETNKDAISEDDVTTIIRPFLDKDIISTDPRDRPLVNILFQTYHMKYKLRPWVKRDLVKSRGLISRWENQRILSVRSNNDDDDDYESNSMSMLESESESSLNSNSVMTDNNIGNNENLAVVDEESFELPDEGDQTNNKKEETNLNYHEMITNIDGHHDNDDQVTYVSDVIDVIDPVDVNTNNSHEAIFNDDSDNEDTDTDTDTDTDNRSDDDDVRMAQIDLDFSSMKLVELQSECNIRNLPKYGRKAELIDRLKESS